MGNADYTEFINSIKKIHNKRNNRIKNSYGSIDGYRYYRKNKPKDPKYILTDCQYLAITRKINKILAGRLSKGEDIMLPERMGRLEIRKFKSRLDFKNGKVKTNLPIDWNRTLHLWYEDEEAKENKVLIRCEESEIYQVYYNKLKAKYNNKQFYCFEVNRDIKQGLKNNIRNGIIDAFIIN